MAISKAALNAILRTFGSVMASRSSAGMGSTCGSHTRTKSESLNFQASMSTRVDSCREYTSPPTFFRSAFDAVS